MTSCLEGRSCVCACKKTCTRFTKWYTGKWHQVHGCFCLGVCRRVSFFFFVVPRWSYQELFSVEPLLTSLFAQTLISIISARINSIFSRLALFTIFFHKSIQCCSAPTSFCPRQCKANIISIRLWLAPVKASGTSTCSLPLWLSWRAFLSQPTYETHKASWHKEHWNWASS